MSWWQLVETNEENAQEADRLRDEPPTSCPNDGEPLLIGPDETLYCPWDGWRYEQ